MTTLSSSIHPEQQTGPTSVIAEEYEHEIRCGMCARAVDVAEETYLFARDAMNSGLDNPFRCEVCSEEYDDLVHN